ncbi:MAG: hypothetical protein IJ017_05760 [Oscillospiraceae bacterium]|nr:hypothetical protein [Oscillospiraceae bacterium]
MFGTYEKHNLRRAAFSRELNFWTIYEDFREPILGITVSKDGTFLDQRSNTFLLYPTFNGTIIPYTYFADVSHLRMDTEHGTVEFCMNDKDQLRIKGKGVGLRFVLRAEKPFGSTCGCRGIYPTPENAWEADMGKSGKMLIVPLSGGFAVTNPWNVEKNEYDKVEIDFIPDAATGGFDAAIHEYMDFRTKDAEYPAFEEVKAESQKSFDDFVALNLRKPAKGWEGLFQYAAYTVWSHRCGVCGNFTEPMVFMHLIWANYAMSWQQSYNAMPMLNNPREAWRLIKVMFNYQVPNGQVSASVNYHGVGVGGMQPPFQALALDWIFSQCGDDWLTVEDCEEMYPKIESWLNFWLSRRNAGHGDDRCHIFSAHESGWDDLSLYSEGFPIETPDIFSYLIMMMDALGRMAKKMGKTEESEHYYARSKKLLDTLVTELWDGEQFVGYMSETGKRIKCKSLDMFQSLVLGKDRLPQHIIDKLAEDIMLPGEWMTDIGLATESLTSPLCHFGYNFVLGRVITPCNMLTAVGFYRCGKIEVAKEICRRCCQNQYDNGIILGYAPMDTEVDGSPIDTWPNPTASDGWSWTTWAASSVLTMITGILPDGE